MLILKCDALVERDIATVAATAFESTVSMPRTRLPSHTQVKSGSPERNLVSLVDGLGNWDHTQRRTSAEELRPYIRDELGARPNK